MAVGAPIPMASGITATLVQAGDRLGDLLPALSLRFENRETGECDGVVPAAPLTVLLNPPPDDPLTLFHPIEHGIERRDVECEHALRSALDELRELVAVSRLVF